MSVFVDFMGLDHLLQAVVLVVGAAVVTVGLVALDAVLHGGRPRP